MTDITVSHIDYTVADKVYKGTLYKPTGTPQKVVLVAHAWGGQSDYERLKAELIAARFGYAAFCLDVYGKGIRGSSTEENQALMMPLMEDRAELQARLDGAIRASKALDGVETDERAAIGFCFGGLCALDMGRAGLDVAGVASFHGLLGAPGNLTDPKIDAKVIAYHGWDDPMAKPEDALAFAAEMTAAKADWQLHAFGGVMHAFTTPGANDPDFGTVYDEAADHRSWTSLERFLHDVLGPPNA